MIFIPFLIFRQIAVQSLENCVKAFSRYFSMCFDTILYLWIHTFLLIFCEFKRFSEVAGVKIIFTEFYLNLKNAEVFSLTNFSSESLLHTVAGV